MKKIYVGLLLSLITSCFYSANAQVQNITLGQTLGEWEGEYQITVNNQAFCDITLDFSNTPVKEVTLYINDDSGEKIFLFENGHSYPKFDFKTGDTYIIDVSKGLKSSIRCNYYSSCTLSWSALKNDIPTRGSATLTNNSTTSDLTILDGQNKSMGSISSQTSDYSKAMVLLQQPGLEPDQLGISPQKISSNTSLGITAASSIYQTADRFAFKTGSAYALTLIDGGKVGIGVDIPISQLDVNGSAILRNRVQIGNTSAAWLGDVISGYANGIDPTDAAIFIPVNLNAASDLRLYIPDDGNDAFSIWGNTCGGGDCGNLNMAQQVVRFEGVGTVRYFGSVGIGKTPSSDIKLDVAGTIRADEILVEANGNTADFVFDEDYHLKDLSEVETFIKTNKHLENIPSATEMEEHGVNLAEMNKLLLQKVEELTVYAIQQNKELKEKDKEVEQLKTDRKKETGKREKLEDKVSLMENELKQIKEMIINNNPK